MSASLVPTAAHPQHQLSDDERSRAVPLVVDMDGTLILADTLYEGCMQLWRERPPNAVLTPLWLIRGRVSFKEQIASRIEFDVRFLPYNEPFIEFLRAERLKRRIVLCTAANYRFAEAVAAHVAIFDEVIATQEGVNLSAHNKAAELVSRYGVHGFDYAGNDVPDIVVFREARYALIINASRRLARRASTIKNQQTVPHTTTRSTIAAHWAALRPSQWVKNLLVFVPLLAAVRIASVQAVVLAVLAFVAFSLTASSVYVLNDMVDLSSDRRHPRKRLRPFASGAVPLRNGLLMVPALLVAATFVASRISLLFLCVLLLYALVTVLYSFWLKRVPLLDTLVLATLYTFRILTGAAAIPVMPSVWLLSFSMFLFLSLALAKRHSELIEMMETETAGNTIPGRDYRHEDLVILISQGSAAGYSAVLVLALYVDSDSVRQQYHHPELIWLICPLVLYWINKLWLNSQRRQIYDEPIIWATRNRVSRAIALVSLGVLLLARWLP